MITVKERIGILAVTIIVFGVICTTFGLATTIFVSFCVGGTVYQIGDYFIDKFKK